VLRVYCLPLGARDPDQSRHHRHRAGDAAVAGRTEIPRRWHDIGRCDIGLHGIRPGWRQRYVPRVTPRAARLVSYAAITQSVIRAGPCILSPCFRC
jgi:hypothetical protein